MSNLKDADVFSVETRRWQRKSSNSGGLRVSLVLEAEPMNVTFGSGCRSSHFVRLSPTGSGLNGGWAFERKPRDLLAD